MKNMTKPSRNTAHTVDATMPSEPSGAGMGPVSDGEKMGVGTKYSATLNERDNKSINRNNGSDIVRASANEGMLPNGSISRASRKTGRV